MGSSENISLINQFPRKSGFIQSEANLDSKIMNKSLVPGVNRSNDSSGSIASSNLSRASKVNFSASKIPVRLTMVDRESVDVVPG